MLQCSNNEKSQLDVYLSEKKLELQHYKDLDILNGWKTNYHRYLDLILMVRDMLTIPITMVALESAFSIGAHVLNKYRSTLLSSNVEALIFIRNWFL